MKGTIILVLVFTFLMQPSFAQTVTDIDGNSYNTVTIGTQIWMKENLKTTRFNNGDSISTISLPIYNDSNAVYQWAYNEDSLNTAEYGRLYTWFVVVDSRNVCPAGWHVPADTEWISLANFLGGDSIAGDKMKEAGTMHWSVSSSSVTNSSDFTALPGGQRGNPAGFANLNTFGNFWTSSSWGSLIFPRAYVYHLKSNSSALSQSVAVANCGFSIRCMMNVATNVNQVLPEENFQIYPNPTKGIFNILSLKHKAYAISIYTNEGVLVHQLKSTDKLTTLDISPLAKGIYILKIKSPDFTIDKKIILE